MHGSFRPRRINYGGETWWRCQSGYCCNTDGMKLHRRVYEDHFGPIPGATSSTIATMTAPTTAQRILKRCRAASTPGIIKLAARSSPITSPQVAPRCMALGEGPVHRLTCLVCDAPFETRSLQAPRPFCSDRCQDRWRANRFAGEARSCDHCGHDYSATRRSQRYCSKICNRRAAQARSIRPREERALMCLSCGQEFTSKRSNAKFCGRACAVQYHGRRPHRRKTSAARAEVRYEMATCMPGA